MSSMVEATGLAFQLVSGSVGLLCIETIPRSVLRSGYP